jgi:hypothetical protein
VIHSQKPGRLLLNLYNISENYETEITPFLSQLKRRLLKRISIDYVGWIPRYPGILQQFCQEYGQQVDHIRFYTFWSTKEITKDVLHVLENNLCPNLRRLEGDLFNSGTIICPFLPIMHKLEFISISFALGQFNILYEDDKVN